MSRPLNFTIRQPEYSKRLAHMSGAADATFARRRCCCMTGPFCFPGSLPAQLYDPVSDSFSPSGAMSTELSAAATLMNGQVLFAGGEPLGRSANAELYNPATHTFARTADMTSRRVWHTLSSLPDGMVLAAGGETDSCSGNACFFAGSVASAELYDPSAGAFVPTGNMAIARDAYGHASW